MKANSVEERIAHILHALRTPVSTVLLWESVLRRPCDRALVDQALDAIRASALAQAALIEELGATISTAIHQARHEPPRG
jgi:signal transduction histidine kinase